MPMPTDNQWTTYDTTVNFDFGDIVTDSILRQTDQKDLFDHSTQGIVDNLMKDHAKIVEEDTREIKESLILEPTGYSVEVYVIAHSKSFRKNKCRKIPCNKTKPLGNWCYDLSKDEFLVECAGFQHLGRFSLGYKARMEGVEGWTVDVPLSMSIIEKRIAPKFKETFESFKKNYPEKDNHYSFIQCSGVFSG